MNKSSSSSVTSLVFVTTQKFQWNFVSWISSLLDHRYVWLFLYFLCNLVLTLHNKFLMSLYHFSLPYSLTGIHALFAFLGCGVCHWCQLFPVTRFSYHEYKWIGAFSILYTLNIALSNASLHLVSVPFHQVARATTPLFTILLSYFFFRKHYSKSILFTQVPIVVGVGLATKGEFNITTYGLVLTFLGTIFAALKGITTNIVLVGQLQLHPLDLLYKMSPLALFQIFMYIAISGEYQRLMVLPLDLQLLLHLTFNGSMAFFLNYVSFTTNKKAGPLTMNVAGIATTLFGGAMYSFLEAQEKMKAIVYSKVDKYTNEL